jgi:hypothetical protein
MKHNSIRSFQNCELGKVDHIALDTIKITLIIELIN